MYKVMVFDPDIREGKPGGEERQSPIFMAIWRSLEHQIGGLRIRPLEIGTEEISVRIGEDIRVFPTPPEVVAFQDAFNSGKSVSPFTFYLREAAEMPIPVSVSPDHIRAAIKNYRQTREVRSGPLDLAIAEVLGCDPDSVFIGNQIRAGDRCFEYVRDVARFQSCWLRRRGKLEPFEFELVPEKRRVRHSEYVPPRFQDGYWNG